MKLKFFLQNDDKCHRNTPLLDLLNPPLNSSENESDTKNRSNGKNEICLPGKAVLIKNDVVEEKPFKTNDDLPETELYFGGERETESEHFQRMIRMSQKEEMTRL